jgi:septal ring factor EnvC (AmiA/AmiB activator)
MKRSIDLTKLYKFKFLIFGFLLFLFLFLNFNSVFSQTKEELESKINLKNTDIDRLEAEIKSYQSELNSLGNQKNSLSKTIKELDITRKKLLLNITLTENKIEKANLKIQNLSNEIITKEDSINRDLKAIKYNIQSVNEIENKNF